MIKRSFVLLVGSPRKRGTSHSFSMTIKRLLEEKGHVAEIVYVIDFLEGDKDIIQIRELLNSADTIGMIMPLYVDFIPYPLIWFLEKLQQGLGNSLKGKYLFAICQYGFPDIKLGIPILRSCELYAKGLKMHWMGGLAYGGGAILDGKPLENLGRTGKKIISCFELALSDILSGNPISASIQNKIDIGLPKILYVPMAIFLNHMSRKTARRFGIRDIRINPYAE